MYIIIIVLYMVTPCHGRGLILPSDPKSETVFGFDTCRPTHGCNLEKERPDLTRPTPKSSMAEVTCSEMSKHWKRAAQVGLPLPMQTLADEAFYSPMQTVFPVLVCLNPIL